MKISQSNAKTTIRTLGKLGGIKSRVIGLVVLGFTVGVIFEEFNGIGTWHSFHPAPGKVSVCFTPPSGCGNSIALEISKAKNSIFVHAYGLTSQPIIRELIKARQRGVKVAVLLDYSNLYDKNSKIDELKNAGIHVGIDKVAGIAHNKIMIIDKRKVITGSFNFTNAADKHNVENVVFINDPAIARTYLQNWLNRRKKI